MLYSGWASISGLQVGREKDAFPHVMRPGERLRTTMIDVCLGDEGAIHGQLVTVEEEASLLRLDVDAEVRRGEEVVECAVSPAEVRLADVAAGTCPCPRRRFSPYPGGPRFWRQALWPELMRQCRRSSRKSQL